MHKDVAETVGESRLLSSFTVVCLSDVGLKRLYKQLSSQPTTGPL